MIVLTQSNFCQLFFCVFRKQKWEGDQIFIFSGADFETLYPEVLAAQPFAKCQLQMMRLVAHWPFVMLWFIINAL